MEPKSPSKLQLSIMGFSHYKWILKICGVCLVILLLLLGVYFASNKAGKAVVKSGFYHYTVVVDCGSTGTRVNVYKWWKPASLSDWDLPILVHSYPDNSTQSLSRGSSCKYHCVQTEPGLDKFVGNSTGVRLSLEPLILWAEQWVPRERHGDTPIFVLATAGLRRLLIEDARQVLDAVEDVVKEHSFVSKKSWIRVLSGKEEAYYGWVALNYKMGSLGNSSMGPTLGLLDLGGSSLQVVMEVHGGGRNDANLIRSKIGLVEHYILAFSLSSFGLNEAFDRTVAMLSQVQPGGGGNNERYEVRHPCLGFGFQRNYTCYVCDGINVPYQKNLSIQTHKSELTNTHLVGDPDWEICKGIARAAALNLSSLDWSQPTDLNNCKTGLSSYGSDTLNFIAGTHPSRRFHALSGFFAVYNMLDLAPIANLTKIWEKGQQMCSKSWPDSSNTSGNQNSIGKYCFRVPYMASLIEDALCLGDKEIVFGPGDLSWTLGASLVEAEKPWPSSTETTILSLKSKEVLYSSVLLFLLLLFISFIVYYKQIELPMPGKKIPAVRLSFTSYVHPKLRPN